MAHSRTGWRMGQYAQFKMNIPVFADSLLYTSIFFLKEKLLLFFFFAKMNKTFIVFAKTSVMNKCGSFDLSIHQIS